MTSTNYAERMLTLAANEIQRALSTTDPLSRSQIIAELVQPYTGWALRWAVDDARKAGHSWPSIAAATGQQQHTTVQRQYAANGPMVAVRPFHTAGSRNDDGQTPLRQAATRLVHQMFPTEVLMASITGRELYRPVDALAKGMTSPIASGLLTPTGAVVDIAERLIRDHGYPEAARSEQETEVWKAIALLRDVYERDRVLIEVADAARREAEERQSDAARG